MNWIEQNSDDLEEEEKQLFEDATKVGSETGWGFDSLFEPVSVDDIEVVASPCDATDRAVSSKKSQEVAAPDTGAASRVASQNDSQEIEGDIEIEDD